MLSRLRQVIAAGMPSLGRHSTGAAQTVDLLTQWLVRSAHIGVVLKPSRLISGQIAPPVSA
jgi:hypothetical protein